MVQYYQCLEYRHMASGCQQPDLSKCCYRCRQAGHVIREYQAKEEYYVIYGSASQEARHRLSSTACCRHKDFEKCPYTLTVDWVRRRNKELDTDFIPIKIWDEDPMSFPALEKIYYLLPVEYS